MILQSMAYHSIVLASSILAFCILMDAYNMSLQRKWWGLINGCSIETLYYHLEVTSAVIQCLKEQASIRVERKIW